MNEQIATLFLSMVVGVIFAATALAALGDGRRRTGIALMVVAALFAAPSMLRLLAAAWAS